MLNEENIALLNRQKEFLKEQLAKSRNDADKAAYLGKIKAIEKALKESSTEEPKIVPVIDAKPIADRTVKP